MDAEEPQGIAIVRIRECQPGLPIDCQVIEALDPEGVEVVARE